MGRRNSKTASVVLLVSLVISTPVYADTTSDVYGVYGIKDTTAYALQDKKVVELMEDYNTKCQEYNYALDYNEVIDKLDIPSLENRVDTLSIELTERKEGLLREGIYMTYDELAVAYDEYLSTLSEYNDLKALVDKYNSMEEVPIPEYNFDDLLSEIESEMSTLEAIQGDADIGDVDNLYNFLQASYTVKRKFDGVGLTLKAVQGTGVLSIFDGNVIYSDRNEITGETIKIDSGDGIIITYTGLSARYVQAGDVVAQYQKIATTGENLYITLEINGEYYDLNELYGG